MAKKSRIQTTLLQSRKHGAYVQDPENSVTELSRLREGYWTHTKKQEICQENSLKIPSAVFETVKRNGTDLKSPLGSSRNAFLQLTEQVDLLVTFMTNLSSNLYGVTICTEVRHFVSLLLSLQNSK
jgi:hypothetical protein